MSATVAVHPARQSKWEMIGISLLAGLVYGSWAAFSNHEYGVMVATKAGLGQGAYALFSTWLVTWTGIRVFQLYNGGWRGFLTGFTSSFLVMLAIPIAIHAILKTPNMWMAILPGLIWGSCYIAIYLRRYQLRAVPAL